MVRSLRLMGWAGALVALLAVGCSVDTDFARHDDRFKCSTNADCSVGYICVGASQGQVGACSRFGGDGTDQECHDDDGDGFFPVSPGCVPLEGQADCNDDDRFIHPGATEECDGVDQDCDDDIDEDIAPQLCPLQLGVCAGATAECVDGAFQDCIAQGLYGEDFENVADEDESCDGIDNNCSGGYPSGASPEEVDAQCDCIPGVTGPSECSDYNGGVGQCQRGVRLCQADGSFSACGQATLGDTCTSDEQCGENGFCIDERLDPREDLFDDCVLGSEAACERRVCRILEGSAVCENDGQCDASAVCLVGFCQPRAQTDEPETCDGVDNDCNGRIDDADACQERGCPFGMTFIPAFSGNPLGLCIDQWEASRPDATAGDAGVNELYAVSRSGVLPWTGVDTSGASAACAGTAINAIIAQAVPVRRLCGGAELGEACDGGDGTYPYGAGFQAGLCNDATSGSDLEPTGSHAQCCAQIQGDADALVCDLSGNAEEAVSSPFVGGFGGNASDDAAEDLTCEVATTSGVDASLIGFRCCSQPLQ